MQILLSAAKDQHDALPGTGTGAAAATPRFDGQAGRIAVAMAEYDVPELCAIFKCNADIARRNKLRFQRFLEPGGRMPAALAYNGIAYKCLDARNFSGADRDYAQRHLFITSFFYGLLRPFDAIKPYRMEGGVRLPAFGHKPVRDVWKPLLTDCLIDAVRADDGRLLNVASQEMKGLFDWQRVQRAVEIVEPRFVVNKQGKYKTLVVYAKMCRGRMARFAIQHRLATFDGLQAFDFEGFRHHAALSRPDAPVFANEPS